MKIKLIPKEVGLRTSIKNHLNKLRSQLSENRRGSEVSKLLDEMGKKAHELHMSLAERGHEPTHHRYMINNRGMQPNDPEFYKHIHPVEDLLAFIEDTGANDDPQDQTIGDEFSFTVYSRRWGHEDPYQIKRTVDGWFIKHISIDGPCDKTGKPFLFENLRHDYIQYPNGLGGYLEWLWGQAETKGLTHDEVQKGLNDLASWVSKTEKSSPKGDVWEGY